MNPDVREATSVFRRVPIFTTTEVAECGLACLAMIGSFHGHDVNLNGLRQRFPISTSGMTLATMMSFANELNFSARAVNIKLADLKRLRLPAVLHWNLNHFVVLVAIRRGMYIIHDPAFGRQAFPLDEVSLHFTGVALELLPRAEFKPVAARTRTNFGDLISKLTGVKRVFLQLVLLTGALQLFVFIAPLQIQFIVDAAIDRGDFGLLTVISFGFMAALVFQTILDAARAWSIQVVGSSFYYQVGGNVVSHLLRLPTQFFERRHVGDIISRMGSVNAIQESLAHGLITAFIDALAVAIACALMFLYSPALAGIVIAGTVLNLAVTAALYPFLRTAMARGLEAGALEQSYLLESIRAATITKIMGGEAQREAGWRSRFATVVRTTLAINRIQTIRDALYGFISGAQLIAVLYLGAREVIKGGGMSIGMLLAFISYRQIFTDRTGALIVQSSQFRLLGLHVERLSDIVGTPADDTYSVPSAVPMRGGVEFRDVTFSYGLGEPDILKKFSLAIRPGEFVAITGPSGCGKSTLLKLLLGIQTQNGGEIWLDGVLATPAHWREWRKSIGYVAQDDRLYSGTIADNISFFDTEIDMHRVQRAAATAQVHDEIIGKPMQYLSLVGDMGASLSGGQRQRILLARALYRQPKLLILDEGTANLDEATESTISDTIAGLEITRIIVAHRPALIQRASVVIRLDDSISKMAISAANVR